MRLTCDFSRLEAGDAVLNLLVADVEEEVAPCDQLLLAKVSSTVQVPHARPVSFGESEVILFASSCKSRTERPEVAAQWTECLLGLKSACASIPVLEGMYPE